jgi:hypothetical protein
LIIGSATDVAKVESFIKNGHSWVWKGQSWVQQAHKPWVSG